MTTMRITIRHATPGDASDLERLAQLEGVGPPAGDVLVAEVDGQLSAAVELGGGSVIADPFRPSGEASELLRLRVERLHEARRRRRVRRRPAGRHGIRRRG